MKFLRTPFFIEPVRWLLLFLHILDKQDPAIQYTIEHEELSKSLNFLNIRIMNTINDKNEFKVHRKDPITNINIKPTSCILPNTIKAKKFEMK